MLRGPEACYATRVKNSHAASDVKVAVLLVAGAGTRLGDPEGRPKSLVEIAGRSMLARAAEHLRAVGVEHLVLATGYREEAIVHATANLGMATSFCRNDAYASTQNAVSLLRCASAIGDASFFKLDGDVLFQPEVLLRLLNTDGQIAAAVDTGAALADEEMKVYVQDGRITHFGKGLDPKRSAGESIGIERVDASVAPQLFAALARAERQGRTNLYYEDVYQELIDQGVRAGVADVTDLPWIEVDTREDLARATELFGA